MEPRTFPNMRQESGSTKRNNTKPLNPNKPSGRPCALGQVHRHSRRSKRDERLGQVMAELGVTDTPLVAIVITPSGCNR